MPKKLNPATQTNGDDPQPVNSVQSLALTVSDEQYMKALDELLKDARSPSPSGGAPDKLLSVFVGLFVHDFTDAEIEILQKKADYPRLVGLGLEAYKEMQKLTAVCVPRRDRVVGPSCQVVQLDEAQIKRLSPDQRQLERDIRGCFNGSKKKPTLQGLASESLTQQGERGYSLRNIKRCVKAVAAYKFMEGDPHRRLIESVNSFGERRSEITATGDDWTPGPITAERLAHITRGVAETAAMLFSRPSPLASAIAELSLPLPHSDFVKHALADITPAALRAAAAAHAEQSRALQQSLAGLRAMQADFAAVRSRKIADAIREMGNAVLPEPKHDKKPDPSK